ncbi:hypothetical protein CLOSTASPAR_04312 [[Clostridium] asparagiforme DSM 15981]|uniref:Uncharacterized protein n=1 Tax=[Clostridium] asparagiforme DSM 15981 TaxID=518636 RepID=C0D4W5_9FIRM|nr:hypothetical protein CLOSTASPAR_04312 [[Clostridium] asparagiforme DSM 15981]
MSNICISFSHKLFRAKLHMLIRICVKERKYNHEMEKFTLS